LHFSLSTLQRIDRDLGPLACAALEPFRIARGRRREPADVRSILAVKFWGLGSLTLLGPALRRLRERHPGARIDLLTLRGNEAFSRRLPILRETLTLDLGGGPLRLARSFVSLVIELRRRRYDLLVDFEFFTRFSAALAYLSGARWTVGFWSPHVYRGRFHDVRVPFNRYRHVARNFRALAGGDDGATVDASDLLRPRFGREVRERVARILARRGLPDDRPLVVVNPNAGDLALERRWPAGHFVSLVDRLVRPSGTGRLRHGAAVVWIGSPSERAYVESLRARLEDPDSTHDLAGVLSIEELLALLERADLLVTNDSGPLHLASPLGTPTIALFGPETPVLYAPLNPRARVFYRPPPCSPCINVHENKMLTCYFSQAICLSEILPEEVAAAAASALEESSRLAPEPAPVPVAS
jgi:lipopolysaccharide heptosyltransferase II